MTSIETATLTGAMRDSGRVFKWPDGTPPKVDKHSTGGIVTKGEPLLTIHARDRQGLDMAWQAVGKAVVIA